MTPDVRADLPVTQRIEFSATMKELLMAIDVGGTKIEAVAVDLTGQPLGQLVTNTDNSGPEGLLDSVEDAVHRVLAQSDATTSDLAGVGLGVPGQVDPIGGVVRRAVNLNLSSFPLAMALAGRLRTPVDVENDVRLAALGLYQQLRQEQNFESLAYVSVGTGVAAGIVDDGRLLRGASGMAGEIGHVVFDPAGERCSCGLQGCLETIVSGPAITRQATPFLHGDREEMTAGDVYAAAGEGNAQAQALVHRVSLYMARALHWLVMTYDVERVVVGGGVTAAGDAFWQPIADELSQLRRRSALAHDMLPQDKITLLNGDENPAIWGAIGLAQQAAGAVDPTF